MFTKRAKDELQRIYMTTSSKLFNYPIVPKGLYDSREYFRAYKDINFEDKRVDGLIVAKSTNFKWGTIVTYGRTPQELDKKIKDAILTAFEIPSSYAKEAQIKKVGKKVNQTIRLIKLWTGNHNYLLIQTA